MTQTTSTVYGAGPIHTDNLQVGDQITAEWFRTYGPILAIRPYVSQTHPEPTWRVATFANGVQITMIPGATWLPG